MIQNSRQFVKSRVSNIRKIICCIKDNPIAIFVTVDKVYKTIDFMIIDKKKLHENNPIQAAHSLRDDLRTRSEITNIYDFFIIANKTAINIYGKEFKDEC